MSFSCSGVDLELALICLRAVRDLFKNCPGVIFKLSESCLVFVPELLCSISLVVLKMFWLSLHWPRVGV